MSPLPCTFSYGAPKMLAFPRYILRTLCHFYEKNVDNSTLSKVQVSRYSWFHKKAYFQCTLIQWRLSIYPWAPRQLKVFFFHEIPGSRKMKILVYAWNFKSFYPLFYLIPRLIIYFYFLILMTGCASNLTVKLVLHHDKLKNVNHVVLYPLKLI